MYGAMGVPYSEPESVSCWIIPFAPFMRRTGLVRVAFPKIKTMPAKDVDGISVPCK